MDYQMYKKSAELLRKDYKALGKHIHKSDTATAEYVMNVINKDEDKKHLKRFMVIKQVF